MNAILYIAYKYLFFKNKTQAVNILSLITMIAMGCGAGALLIILSTFNGFEQISKSLSESFQSDLVIRPKKNKQFDLTEDNYRRLTQIKNVTAISKVLEEKVYIKYQESDALATLKGVDEHYFQTNQVKDFIVAGDTVLNTDEHSFALIGAGIASRMNIDITNQLESISVYYPRSEFSGGLSENFELSYLIPGGVFSIYQDFDDQYIIAPLAFVQYLNNSDDTRLSAIELKINSRDEHQIRSDIQNILGDNFTIKNKLEQNETFYKISRIEKLIVTLIMVFVLIILSFNFIGSLTMHIIEKSKDLKTIHYLGLSPKYIFWLYIILGLFQGMLGGIVGLVLGYIICKVQQMFGIIPMPGSGTFVISSYPVEIYHRDILTILLILMLVSILASIFPAIRAKKSLQILS